MDNPTRPPTDPQTPAPNYPAPTQPAPAEPPRSAEAFFSLIIGITLLLIGRNFFHYLLAVGQGKMFDTGFFWPVTNLPVAYFDLQGFTAWTETAFVVAGLALLLDALSRMVRHRGITVAAFLALLASIAVNVFVAIKLFNVGIVPLISLLLIALTGYLAMTHWAGLKPSAARRAV